MRREEVYKVIDDERDYQDEQTANPDRPDMNVNLSVGDYLLAIEYNMQEAKKLWYKGAGHHPSAMHYLRKVAALAVSCFEKNGVPKRVRD